MGVVRNTERFACDLGARLRVAPSDAGQVALSRARAGPGGALAVRVVNYALGGLGLRSAVLLPRGARVEVEVEGAGGLRLEGRVQRVTMAGRDPWYEVGLALRTEPGAGGAERALALLSAAARGGNAA